MPWNDQPGFPNSADSFFVGRSHGRNVEITIERDGERRVWLTVGNLFGSETVRSRHRGTDGVAMCLGLAQRFHEHGASEDWKSRSMLEHDFIIAGQIAEDIPYAESGSDAFYDARGYGC